MMLNLNWIDSIAPRLRINFSLTTVFDSIMACIERVQQRRALARLDDRLLADIGRSRAEISAEIDKPFWRD